MPEIKRKRKPMTDEQRAVMAKARALSKAIGFLNQLDASGLDQASAFIAKRQGELDAPVPE